MRKSPRNLIIGLAVLVSTGSMTATFAQNTIKSKQMPAAALRQMKPRTGRSGDAFAKLGAAKCTGSGTFAATSGTPGVDSLAN